MMSQEDNLVTVNEFLERGDRRMLVIYVSPNGQLVPVTTFPTSAKAKAVYFIKRQAEALKKDNMKSLLMVGDVSHLPLDQLSFLVESVSFLCKIACFKHAKAARFMYNNYYFYCLRFSFHSFQTPPTTLTGLKW